MYDSSHTNAHTMEQRNTKTYTHELGANNNINIWTHNFVGTYVGFVAQQITNYNGLKCYNVNYEYVIT